MKKYITIAFILSASIIFSACTQKKIETEDTKTSEITAASTDDDEEIKKDFTEGIWIKKYPDNYACFKFETPEGYKIICDPYRILNTIHPDIVIESHQHLDHTDTSNLEQPYELITKPGKYNIDNVVINGYAGKHNAGDKENTNNIFVINMNNITIANFASQGELPSDEVLEQIGTVDILLLQLFENPDSNKLQINDADKIISKLNPKIVIPEHGDQNVGDQLAKHLNVTEEFEYSGNIIITRDMLDDIDGIRVINLDNMF